MSKYDISLITISAIVLIIGGIFFALAIIK
jgi:hypothetical protein